ncbi:MAG: hypothetical protein ABWY06_21665 [Pseudomonas sp.]|uniref:hypothetical protein n=1 Tax=Pseudomonas sp. TaxID=306 RepID=UPI00339871FB
MQTGGFFEWLGQALGAVIRFIVEGLGWLFDLFANAGSSFLHGLSSALGLQTSVLSLVALVIGLLLLAAAVRAFIKRSFVMGTIWALLGLWLLSWLIN